MQLDEQKQARRIRVAKIYLTWIQGILVFQLALLCTVIIGSLLSWKDLAPLALTTVIWEAAMLLPIVRQGHLKQANIASMIEQRTHLPLSPSIVRHSLVIGFFTLVWALFGPSRMGIILAGAGTVLCVLITTLAAQRINKILREANREQFKPRELAAIDAREALKKLGKRIKVLELVVGLALGAFLSPCLEFLLHLILGFDIAIWHLILPLALVITLLLVWEDLFLRPLFRKCKEIEGILYWCSLGEEDELVGKLPKVEPQMWLRRGAIALVATFVALAIEVIFLSGAWFSEPWFALELLLLAVLPLVITLGAIIWVVIQFDKVARRGEFYKS